MHDCNNYDVQTSSTYTFANSHPSSGGSSIEGSQVSVRGSHTAVGTEAVKTIAHVSSHTDLGCISDFIKWAHTHTMQTVRNNQWKNNQVIGQS